MRRASDLVNLGPAVLDARYVKQGRTVLPEGSLLDIEDESDGREVHVGVSIHFSRVTLGSPVWCRRVLE